MSILFATVTRGTTVLARHAACQGNFAEVVEQILLKVSPENAKLTYSHGSYLFHYMTENRITYLCITDDDFQRSKAFMYLNEISRRFANTYGARAQTALPFAMNSEFSRVLSTEMMKFSEDKNGDKLTQVQNDLDELNRIMVKNIDTITNRGERLELLVDKTEDLESSSLTFKKTSKNLSRSMCLKNAKFTIILIIVIILVIYFIISASCGGLSWPKCT
ncbi:vesicle-associated membrane protein 7-like [Anneissia japonica]|uniref:vesicle-associated membrane protein 7-like n=1 Tax=Anneissia japonica TaxID=1529436 RepID=UPI0014258C64|nr:vesicle-associated membrane protein 7-like [Anneissia japonica]